MIESNHLHLLVKGYVNNPPKAEKLLNIWLKELANRMDMEILIDPTSAIITKNGNEGLVGGIILTDATASIRVWNSESPALFQFNLYSYNSFNATDIIHHINFWFELNRAHWQLVDRNGDTFKTLKISNFKK